MITHEDVWTGRLLLGETAVAGARVDINKQEGNQLKKLSVGEALPATAVPDQTRITFQRPDGAVVA